jgi:hypothetical protein
MSVSVSALRKVPGKGKPISRGRPARIGLLLLSLVVCSSGLLAQEGQPGGSTVVVDKQLLQQMMQRIDQLEARVQELEADKQDGKVIKAMATVPPAPTTSLTPAVHASVIAPSPVLTSQMIAPTTASPSMLMSAFPQPGVTKQMPGSTQIPSAPEAEQAQLENPMAERMDFSKTLLRIRGFGDISLIGGNQDAQPANNIPAQTTSFALGELDLFITSDISEKFNFLTELVFEGGPDNIYGVQRGVPNAFKVEPERYLIQYSYNDYLNISAGRFHTAIGYYNTAYHHSTWFQTTTDRPYLFAFEDEGGILPTHTVGVSATGLIPSGSLGLHYVAEVGNGRASRDPLVQEPVQNEVDDENHKAYNLAVFARPEAVPGLQTGFSVYRDLLIPINSPKVSETIMAFHAVLERQKYEWLNEVLLDRQALANGGRVYNTPGFYSLVSRQFGAWRPYFRYQYVNVAKTNPIFPDVGLQNGPSVGIRFDASEFVAVKFQYDHTFQRQEPGTQPGFSTLTLQIGFTF